MEDPAETQDPTPGGAKGRAKDWLASVSSSVKGALGTVGPRAGRFVVVFELKTKVRYEEVAKAMAINPRSARVTASSWVVATDVTAFELRDSLKPLLSGRGERLFVVAVAGSLAWTNLSEPTGPIEALFKE